MIEKPLPQDDPFGLVPEDEEEIIIEETPLFEGAIEEPDGSLLVTFGTETEEGPLPSEHDANLAQGMSKDKLQEIRDLVMTAVKSDKDGRAEWEQAYADGLDYLGIKTEDRTKPWKGAAGVYHPLLMESVVRFQSQAMAEIYPAAGPAKTRILGKETPQARKLATRVQDELNYQITQRMTEYRGETERLLFRLGYGGSCFRKVYYDREKDRPRSMFVAAEDFIVPSGESDLSCCPRFTHVLRLTSDQMKRMQVRGYYLDEEIGEPVTNTDDIQEAKDEITGVTAVSPEGDRYEIHETHIDLDLGEDPDGLPLPYVVCLETSSEKILSIRRNWEEDDPNKERCSWFVAYEYIPGFGFYGMGLIHLIGGIAKASTSIMRQLIDAGTLSNLPGGLKSRDLRMKADDTPIRPGEFRDVDVASGKVADAITFLPYKEPSGVLYQLLQTLVEEGRRVGSIAELDVGDMSGEAPVGTVLALLERAQKVMNAVQARLHESLGRELKLISKIIEKDMGPEYSYNPGGANQKFDRKKDFAQASIEIVPVSDPGATTMSQRVVQHQAAIAMASQAPQLYDMPKLHRVGLEILGIKDAAELVPSAEEMKPADPISENMAALQGKPLKAFIQQDHEAHLQVHLAAMQDPEIQKLVGQSPQAAMIGAAMQAHVAEHLAFLYRQKMEQMMGAQLPPPGEELSPEQEAQIARAAVPAAQALLQQNQQKAAQEQAQAVVEDPLVQLQARELAIKEAEIERKRETDAAKLELDAEKTAIRAMTEMARIEAQREADGARIGVDVAKAAAGLQNDAERIRLAEASRKGKAE